MFKLIIAIFLAGFIAGVWYFSSDSSKESVKQAGTELVNDAKENLKDAALEQTEKAGKKVIARVSEIKDASKEKAMNK